MTNQESSPICADHEYVVKKVFKTYVEAVCNVCSTVKNFERND